MSGDEIGYVSTQRKEYWNFRLMRLPLEDALDPDAFDLIFVEVYYENDIPHSWAHTAPIMLDGLDLEDTTHDELREKMSFEVLRHMSQLQEAIEKPILLPQDFY